MISVDAALKLILAEAQSFGSEKIPLEKSVGRVAASDIRADRDYPPFNRSVMDGYALQSASFSSEKTYPVSAAIFAGDKILKKTYAAGSAVKIMTGAPVPRAFDAVIRSEGSVEKNGVVAFKDAAIARWHNISPMGEDLKRGAPVAIAGNRIDQAVVTALASLGVARPAVQKLPRVAIVTTGNEIISIKTQPQPQQIRNSNLFALRAMLASYGIVDITAQHVADDKARLTAALRPALKADIVLLTGGVSAGDSDYVPEILQKLKVKEIFHKTAMKPGKPLWFGARGKTRVFAIPGNPWSSQVVFKVYIEAYLRQCFGMDAPLRMALPLAEPRLKKDALQHFFPVRIANKAGSPSELKAIAFNGSGDIRAGLGSDGLAVHPAHKNELTRGELVEFLPW